MSLKKYLKTTVLEEARTRVSYAFDNMKKVYVSFSGGKDSTVMTHLVLEEAKRRNKKVGLLIIDLEAQYRTTIEHVEEVIEEYKDNIELYWVALPMRLRNAVSNFSPSWVCWDDNEKHIWVRDPNEKSITDKSYFNFFMPEMEFEEFIVEFGEWYAKGESTACFVGIRTDESLNRFRTIASAKKERLNNKCFTTKVTENVYNFYPLYDWRTEDIWRYISNEKCSYNKVYEYMTKAGLSIHQQRLCQPYGDDQRKGLWLYHILEPDTWYKLINRVSGVNGGALYVRETGNITGYNKITKPDNHTWKSYCGFLLSTMPKKTREHYIKKFNTFIKWWKKRGYECGIPDFAPQVLESKKQAPSYRRLCKVLLRNDYWCKGLNFTQPLSTAYKRFKDLKKTGQLT